MAAPTWTGQKIVVTYVTQGDTRHLVFYMSEGDGVGSDGSLGGPLTTIIAKLALCIPHNDRILSIVGHNQDGSTLAAASGFPQNDNTYSFQQAVPILAYHFVMKDSQGRNCGHTVHEVAASDTGNANLDIGENVTAIANGNKWKDFTDSLVGHTTTVKGHGYTSLMHVRLVLKRDRQTGGRGRKMTTQRALKYLEKHAPQDIAAGVQVNP